MTDFTYEIPNEERFLRAVLIKLNQSGHGKIASLLEESKCSINSTSQFSYKRWNGNWTSVDFEIPLDRYEEIIEQISSEDKEIIRSICQDVMPSKNGLDVMKVKFSLSLEDLPRKKDLISEIKKIGETLPPELKSELIPEDVKANAKLMSETYAFLYCVENALRAFIEKIARENYGDDYLEKLNLTRDMKKKINRGKKSQEKRKWLSVRGNSDIFYLDIDDL